jgi:hypothetical protein
VIDTTPGSVLALVGGDDRDRRSSPRRRRTCIGSGRPRLVRRVLEIAVRGVNDGSTVVYLSGVSPGLASLKAANRGL